MTLRKIKRPGGVFNYEVTHITEDEFGVWLLLPRGSHWNAPHSSGTLRFDCVLLLKPEQYWIACWANDPSNRRLEIDVCLPPQREPNGWSYVDLELDPVRHENGFIEIQDRDEFDAACCDGWIAEDDARIANSVASTLETALHTREEPFGDEGWRRLDAVTRNTFYGNR